MTRKTLYDILELRADASAEQIRAAYEKFMALLDPANPKAATMQDREIRMVAVKEAYAILGHPQQRDAYDARQRAAATANVLLSTDLPLHEDTPLWHRPQVWFAIIVGIFILMGISTWRASRSNTDAIARATALQERAQTGDLAERERQMSDDQERRQRDREAEAARRIEEQNQRDFEAARNRAENASDAQAYRQQRDEADARRAQQQREREDAQREYEERRAARERLERDKAQLRELEANNRRRNHDTSADIQYNE